MDLATKLKSLIKSAEVYQTQGLFSEARQHYGKAREMIAALPQIKNQDVLLRNLDQKLNRLDTQIKRIERAPLTPEISPESQTLIKRLFSFSASESPENAALQGALALVQFGQYNRAIREFEALLDSPGIRFAAAKNILRCALNTDDPRSAVKHYQQWIGGRRFDAEMMGKLKRFLENLLPQKGIAADLAEPEQATLGITLIELPQEVPEEEEVIDITAVSFDFVGRDRKKQRLEYEVSFQSRNLISILLTEREKEVFEALQLGETIGEVELTSPIAIFKGTAKIMEKNQIKVGPRKGCFSVGLKIASI